MQRRRTRAVRFLLLFLPLSLLAQQSADSSVPRYRLLHLTDAANVLRGINEAGADGYRVRALVPQDPGAHNLLRETAGAAIILERVTSPLESFQYLQLAGKGGSTLQERLNEAGAKGFQVLPRNVAPAWSVPYRFVVVWMEKAPGTPRQYEYVVVEAGMKKALKASFDPSLWFTLNQFQYVRPEIAAAIEKGFHVAALLPPLLLILERAAEAPTAAQEDATQASKTARLDLCRSFGYSKPSKLRKELREAASAGYHIADLLSDTLPFYSNGILEKVAGATGTYDYDVLEAKGISALEIRLNDAATNGFRLLPYSLRFPGSPGPLRLEAIKVRAIVEKVPGPTIPRQYRLIARTGTDPEALYAVMMGAAEQGYRVAGLWNSNVATIFPGPREGPRRATSDLLILIMEKTAGTEAEKETP